VLLSVLLLFYIVLIKESFLMGMGFASGGGLFSCLSFLFPGSGGGRVGFLPGFSTLILPRPRILFRRKEVQCAPGFSLPLPGHYSLFL
jgi:hypothetical protein